MARAPIPATRSTGGGEEQAGRTLEPGWTEAEPQLLLPPAPARDAVLSWALPDHHGTGE